MPVILRFLTALLWLAAWLPLRAEAESTVELQLAAGEVFRIAETVDWRVEVLRQQSGRFADVRVSPKQGQAFVLNLYFIADTPDMARLDSAGKIAQSVREGAERYLEGSLEKEITLLPISAPGSYGYRTVLTAAAPGSTQGGYRYLTLGMLRLSPDAALGFSLLSEEMDTSRYQRVLDYAYSFNRFAGAAQPQVAERRPRPPAAKPPSAPASAVRPSRTPRAGAKADLRDCLSLPSAAEVARCTHAR